MPSVCIVFVSMFVTGLFSTPCRSLSSPLSVPLSPCLCVPLLSLSSCARLDMCSVWVWCVSLFVVVCGCGVWLCVVVCGCVWMWWWWCVCGWCVVCGVCGERERRRGVTFHDVCFSKPLTFHNGFMVFVASRSCFKHFSRLRAVLDL